MAPLTATYVVPGRTRAAVEACLASLGRRARRLKITEPRAEWSAVRDDDTYILTVTGENVALSGWKFIGAVRPIDGSDEVAICGLPGEAIPASYRDTATATNCDHCRKVRRRNATYILRHEDDGRYARVGRNCLRDFLGGTDPHASVLWAEALATFESDVYAASASDGGSSGGYSRRAYTTLHVLTAAAWAVRVDGRFISRAYARDNDAVSTAQMTIAMLTGDRYALKGLPRISDEDRERAEQILTWALAEFYVNEDQPPVALNDYAHNVRAVLRSGEVEARWLALIASLTGAYARAQGEAARAALPAAPTRWLHEEVGWRGEPGTARVLKIIPMPGDFGTRYLITLGVINQPGVELVWWASSDPGFTEGQEVNLKATIKAKTMYRGRHQTVITRATLLND